MKVTLLAILLACAAGLTGCGIDSADLFPNAPEGSFIKTGIGPGPATPVGPSVGHTTANPTGVR